MIVLGIETTCDETACSIVKDGRIILSQTISSQIELHRPFGGVVPELACRSHIDVIVPLLEETLIEAKLKLSDIDLISVAYGPGLIGALLIGINFAKGLGYVLQKPVIGVNHIEAHLYAAMMSAPESALQFPALGVVLSGGHTSIVLIEAVGSYKLLGETIDDAIGEAFDKVAKILGLPYPGGPEIEKMAQQGNATAYHFKPSKVQGSPYHFSFSGLKTSVLYAVKGQNAALEISLSAKQKCDMAASFQRVAFEDVVEKTLRAAEEYGVNAIFLGGGVTRNQMLRSMLSKDAPVPIFWPDPDLCLDNAAMIAGLAFYKFQESPTDEIFALEPETRLPF